MSRFRITSAAMALMSVAALAAACGSDPTPTATAPAATATPVPTATPEAMMMIAPEDVLIVPLNAMSGSGQSGYAKLVANGDQIDVSLSLGAGSLQSEKVHIHAGSCADLGGVEHPLTDFGGGSGSSETAVDIPLSSLGSGDFAINAHEAGNPGNYTACGDLPAATAATTIALNAIDGSGQDGFATLISVGGTTVVAAVLVQGSLASEKVHIHAGQCGEGLGGVDHPLTDFAGGSGGSVTIVEASLASLLGTPHAINAHEAGNPGNYTSCGELPSGVTGLSLDAMMMSPADVLVVALNAMSGSGQTGYAKLVANGDQIDVSLSLGAGSLRSEKVHIHAGSCADLGGVEHALTDFEGGSGSSETAVDISLSSLGSGDFAINAHEAGSPGTYTACGDLPAATAAMTVALHAIDGSGQDGFATLVSVGDTTVVAAVLVQGSLASEKVHIHAGRCGDGLGGVDYPLTDFAGGSGGSVTIVEASLASLLGTPHAINAHEAGNPGNYTSCGELPSGVMTP